MTDISATFARAEAAFRNGRFDEAHGLLTPLAGMFDHPRIFHLLGLVENARGNRDAARMALDRARILAPRDAAIANTLGTVAAAAGDMPAAFTAYVAANALDPNWPEPRLNIASLLRDLGKLPEARDVVEHLLRIAPDLARAWLLLGGIARDQGDRATAADAFERILIREPRHPLAAHGRARIALERGEPAAVELYAHAARLLPDDGDVAIGEAEALEAEGADRADARLDRLVRERTGWAEGHRVLARMRWEAGARDTFTDRIEAALEERPRDVALWTVLVEALAGVDRFGQAADAAARGRAALGDAPELALREAIHAGEAGDDARADALFATLPADLPGRALHEARHRIRTGAIGRAGRLLDTVRARDDGQIGAWALAWLVWRITGDPRAEWLHGQRGLVSARQLDLDGETVAATADFLRRLHRTHAHPIGQSLRGGTQTRGTLFARTEPEIARLQSAISRAVQAHWAELPAHDTAHPLLRHRSATPRFAGSWSVRLLRSGFHVAHIHPDGLLSSAAYFVVPDAGGTDERAGWLEIGRPPADLRLDLPPLATIQPRPGMLALFPSTLYHGTRRFTAAERLTVAFDVTA